MLGRLFVALVVALAVIIWLDPSVLLDGFVWIVTSLFEFGIGLIGDLFGAVEQAIRGIIF
jgi:hypothetical protein